MYVVSSASFHHRAEVGEETDKHRFVLKLLPEMCSERTYYIAFAANHELQVRRGANGWACLYGGCGLTPHSKHVLKSSISNHKFYACITCRKQCPQTFFIPTCTYQSYGFGLSLSKPHIFVCLYIHPVVMTIAQKYVTSAAS